MTCGLGSLVDRGGRAERGVKNFSGLFETRLLAGIACSHNWKVPGKGRVDHSALQAWSDLGLNLKSSIVSGICRACGSRPLQRREERLEYAHRTGGNFSRLRFIRLPFLVLDVKLLLPVPVGLFESVSLLALH